MKLETVKSFILVVLIGISLILSYTLWSYQPNSNQTIGGEIVEEEMNVGGKSDITKQNLIKPSNIVFHTEQGYYGFAEANAKDRMYRQMQEWVITNFEVDSNPSLPVEHSAEAVELIFPEEIPMEVLGSLFTFGQDDLLFPSWSMKRVMISFIYDSKSLQLEFISDESDHRAVALINDTAIFEELSAMVAELDEKTLTPYLVINPDTNPVYFPSGSLNLPIYSITPTEIEPSLFVNILFSTPAVVRETSSQTIGQAYFTDNRQMNVYQNGMRMEYKSLVSETVEDSDRIFTEIDLLDNSIMNINNHSGWTQDYRLEELNMDRKQVVFQMYYQGYPVFNNYSLATIEQIWGVNQNSLQLIEYNRPLYGFEGEFSLGDANDLPSGEDVVDYLESNPDISINNIEDVTIGYELNYRDDQESEYIELTPVWYKKENNVWQKLNFADQTMPIGGN